MCQSHDISAASLGYGLPYLGQPERISSKLRQKRPTGRGDETKYTDRNKFPVASPALWWRMDFKKTLPDGCRTEVVVCSTPKRAIRNTEVRACSCCEGGQKLARGFNWSFVYMHPILSLEVVMNSGIEKSTALEAALQLQDQCPLVILSCCTKLTCSVLINVYSACPRSVLNPLRIKTALSDCRHVTAGFITNLTASSEPQCCPWRMES